MPHTSSENWIAYTDGASRGNPGLSGVGVHLIGPEGEEDHLYEFLGEQTNNQAEYKAMILALKTLAERKVPSVLLRADSELMVKQMRGEYRVKNERIIPLHKEASALVSQFKSVTFEHVRRNDNKVADRLANQAIDERDD